MVTFDPPLVVTVMIRLFISHDWLCPPVNRKSVAGDLTANTTAHASAASRTGNNASTINLVRTSTPAFKYSRVKVFVHSLFNVYVSDAHSKDLTRFYMHVHMLFTA